MASTPLNSSSGAGPSHPTPGVATPLTGTDLKRRAETDADPARRQKHHRPPLPPPHVLQSLIPDSPAFTELLKLESKLDWTLLRKKAEINDALGRPVKVPRALRIFVSNTAHDQAWQKELDENARLATSGQTVNGDDSMGDAGGPAPIAPPQTAPAVDLNTGKGVAGWVLKVQGRLIDSGNARLDRTRRKFSQFIRSAVIEFDNREPPTFPEGNIVEWHENANVAPVDGFEVLRRGDVNVNCRIILHINHQPERFQVRKPLDGLLAMKEGTRAEIMAAAWKLVKVAGAQDKEDGSLIRPLGGLEKILPQGPDPIHFYQFPEIITRFCSHPDPIVIPYTIRVDQDFNLHPKCFDIPVDIEDPLKSKMADIVNSFEGNEGREIAQTEDKVGELAYFARVIKNKRDFLESFAENPQVFIQNWLAAQARDLDQMLGYQIGIEGVNGGSVKEEDLRRSDMFNLPWVDDGVVTYEAMRMEQERRAASQAANAAAHAR